MLDAQWINDQRIFNDLMVLNISNNKLNIAYNRSHYQYYNDNVHHYETIENETDAQSAYALNFIRILRVSFLLL